MLPNLDYSEMPRVLQRLLARDETGECAALSRRSFLKLAGAGGFALGVFPQLAEAQAAGGEPPASALKSTQQPSAFVQIAPNGEVTVTVNRLEFGQGVQTGLPMILAEELDADWNLVRSRHGSNDAAHVDPLMGMHITGGSRSIKNSFLQYRELGARARAMLLSAAAARWNVDVATLRTQAGTVLGPDGRKAGYGELAETAMALPVPEKVTLKDPADFRLIGRPTTRLDASAKSSGRQDFGIDVRRPGQLTAVVARPPVFGARLSSVDDSAARAVKGVKAVLRVPLDRGAEGVAVVADGYWPAKLGRDALKLQWNTADVEKVDSAQATGPVPGTGRSPWPAQVRRRHGPTRHGAPETRGRVCVSLPGPCGHGAAELHRRARRGKRRVVDRLAGSRLGRRCRRALAGDQARAGDGARTDVGRRLWAAVLEQQ